MLQRSVSLSHKVNARIHFIQTKQKQKQTDAPSKAHKMWWNKNIVSGEEPDNVVDEEGDALGIPKLRRLSLLDICRGEPPGASPSLELSLSLIMLHHTPLLILENFLHTKLETTH
jgi:hypothetical protein